MKEKLFISAFAFLLTSCLLSSCYSSSQIKVYAYTQPVITGVSPNTAIDEKGKKVESPRKNRANQYFYFEFKPGKNPTPVAIWFKDKAWKVTTQPVSETPIEIMDQQVPGKSAKTILVPASGNEVVSLSLDFSNPVPFTPNTKLKNLLADSDVVFEYTYKGKTYYKALKKITQLNPVATQ
ncbi:MAG TPA: hypothetical protein VIQ00_16745 [Chitinophagaceae bacterium]